MTIEEISRRAESLYPDNPEYWAVYTAAARDQQQIDIDKAVIWVDENVGSLTAIALRKHLED